MDTRLQELHETCLQLRDDIDQCVVSLAALQSAAQRSGEGIASLAHETGLRLSAHHAQLDRLERYVIADFYDNTSLAQPAVSAFPGARHASV